MGAPASFCLFGFFFRHTAAFSTVAVRIFKNFFKESGHGAPMVMAFSRMLSSSVTISHTRTRGKIKPIKVNGGVTGKKPVITVITKSAKAATKTTAIMPPLWNAPSQACVLDHAPSLAAAALPVSQSAMHSTQATTRQPNQLKAAVKAPAAVTIAALMPKKILLDFPIILPPRI